MELFSRHHRHLAIFYLYACTIVIVVSVMLVGYYQYLDGTVINKIVEFRSTTLQTTKDTYYPGDWVEATVSFCKYRDISPTVQWTLVDTYLRFYAPRQTGVNSTGCFTDRVVRLEMIPLDLPPDIPDERPFFTGKLLYQVNHLRTIEVELKTNSFKVVSRPVETFGTYGNTE